MSTQSSKVGHEVEKHLHANIEIESYSRKATLENKIIYQHVYQPATPSLFHLLFFRPLPSQSISSACVICAQMWRSIPHTGEAGGLRPSLTLLLSDARSRC